jgi:hypothetical protein
MFYRRAIVDTHPVTFDVTLQLHMFSPGATKTRRALRDPRFSFTDCQREQGIQTFGNASVNARHVPYDPQT